MSKAIDRKWIHDAVTAIHADMHRSADTNLLKVKLSKRFDEYGAALYLKDESIHLTGSLKHRLARSLFLYALCNGKLPNADTPVYEASSGSTAISEAYFAHLIGLKKFIAVVPENTSEEKIRMIKNYGGDPQKTTDDIVKVAKEKAEAAGGYFMDQFTFSERATDWRSNNNIAKSIFDQMQKEGTGECANDFRVPKWIVCGAGTGGTSATIGRYARHEGHNTRVCVVDPGEESCYFDKWFETRGLGKPFTHKYKAASSRIEGIGRPIPAESFLPEVIDAMISVPHDASLGAMLYLNETGRHYHGPSTGTNFFGAVMVLQRMLGEDRVKRGSVVTLLCDSGLRYRNTYYNKDWRLQQTYHDHTALYDETRIEQYKNAVKEFIEDGVDLPDPLVAGIIQNFAFA